MDSKNQFRKGADVTLPLVLLSVIVTSTPSYCLAQVSVTDSLTQRLEKMRQQVAISAHSTEQSALPITVQFPNFPNFPNYFSNFPNFPNFFRNF
jgi:hypothetical protein